MKVGLIRDDNRSYVNIVFISEDVDDPGRVSPSAFVKRPRGRPFKGASERLASATKALASQKRRTREKDAEEIERDYQLEQERQERLQTWLNHNQVCFLVKIRIVFASVLYVVYLI